MSELKKIKSALISVYHKTNLEKIVETLSQHDVSIYSTGGTKDFIESLGAKVTPVEDVTTYPSILGGRVKTLHPKIFGGILARRDNPTDMEQVQQFEIPSLDLIIVDLYPFEDTLRSGATHQDIIEKIDIGGISLIRAAAKNYSDVVIVPSQAQYKELSDIIEKQECQTSIEQRKYFAAHAFNVSSHYDTAIFNYFNNENEIKAFRQSNLEAKVLRYGENPHQHGTFYGKFEAVFDQLHGKEISYNNLLDIEAAVYLISEFGETTMAIMKHNNACGIASREVLVDAWRAALAGDPVSAFGGILITNREIDEETANEMDKLFFEVVIAPSYNDSALAILKTKKNRIILV
ncbi:MAG: bifunctional phosphoribosylaminoimidazolecarboxamide formyltransferase/IMP cyclohydrolase, partial [Bacteroidota bacterium]